MLFEKVLEMSLLSCYVIAVVLVIRLLLNKCERKYSFFLWFVVFFNLILPVSIEGPFSLIPRQVTENALVQRTIPEAVPKGQSVHLDELETDNVTNDFVSNEIAMPVPDKEQPYSDNADTLHGGKEPQPQSPVTGVELLQQPLADDLKTVAIPNEGVWQLQPEGTVVSARPTTVAETGSANSTWQIIGSFIWLTGLMSIWGISLYKGILLNRQLKKSRGGQEISQEGVVCARDISAPFLWGIMKPVIYLPESIEEEERIYIMAHESYHKKRYDHITKLLVFVIVTIHWFNPLVWLSYALFVRDMEISCDEAVLAHTGRDIKKQYASSLLKYAAKQNGFVLAPLTFGEPSLKSRIQNVLGYQKKGMVVTIVAVCVVTLTACGLIMRPEGEEAGQSQNGGEQNITAPVEPTQTPEPMQAPETTTSPYSVYFQDILQANYEQKDGKYFAIEGVKEGVNYSYVESVADYKEPEPAYNTTDDYSLDEGICRIDWLRLSNDFILENLAFDMRRELEEAGIESASVHDLFYDRERNSVYIIVNNHMGEQMRAWLICFSPDDVSNYEIYTYEYSSWFGDCYYLDGTIYLHGGSGEIPYVIDVDTKEGRLCTAEYTAARAATYLKSVSYAESHERALYVYWMKGSAKWEDVDIFSGLLMEEMDFFPGVADIYVASRNGEVLETMLVFAENGEVVIVEGLEKNPPVRPLTQGEIDWFNESFFNQGYLGEDANIYERIRNQFLTHEYAKPEDIDISEVFYNGAGEELTEDDRVCLSGEARWKLPLYTGDMKLLSEEEHAGVAQIDVDVSRVSWETMDSILEKYIGMKLWETNRYGMDGLYFNKRDGVYYKFHGDTNTLFVQVKRGHYNADGTLTLYYVRGGSQNWIEEAVEEYAVVLQPMGRGYWFVSNRSLEGSRLEEEQGRKAASYSVTAADHEDYNVIFENNGYQYRFKLDMDTDKLFLLFGEDIERSNSNGKWTVTPVYASNGTEEALLGELRGFTFDVTSDALVEPDYAPGDRFYGIIEELTEENITVCPVEAIDRDTYIEYQRAVVEEPVTYKLAWDVEYLMLDANFRSTNTALERFNEHMSRSTDKVCCFVVRDGVVLQIWEPYIP